MTPKAKDAILKAAKNIADFPKKFEQLLIKDNFLTEEDWDDFNLKLCNILNQQVMPAQLDTFWEENKTFEKMGQYIDNHCNF
jgi:hypothetical protein